MKKETLEYLRGERNATLDEFVLSREKTGNSEYVYVSLPQEEMPIYKLWTKKRKKVRLKNSFTHQIAESDVDDIAKIVKKPKHTGGKRPYVMLMQDKLDVFIDLSLNSSGLLFKIMSFSCIEWHTGRLIDRRTKRSLTRAMLCKMFNCTINEVKIMMSELSCKNILQYDTRKKAYFVNRELVRKGGLPVEDKI